MQFGIFYEHQLPRPWHEGQERQLFNDALDQVELADRLGFDYVWEVEHHFLEEYSHSSAPEVFLAACSQRTHDIRLGHGIVLMPPRYNHPARVAERLSTLDLISNGRVDWGTGSSSSRVELEGFDVSPREKHLMWEEAVRETARMMACSPYPGYRGEYFSMPSRNVIPKPVQQPHPPLWVACTSRETMQIAARHGIGALTFTFIQPEEAKRWVDEYYETFARECRPLGRAVNPNVAVIAGFMCHQEPEVAVDRGLEGVQFFGYGLSHYYLDGTHVPGRSDLWRAFQRDRPATRAPSGAIGSPDQVRRHLTRLESAGIDQVIFIQQGGNNRHEHICESLELFAARVLPEFKSRHDDLARDKAERLAPAVERAHARLPPLPDTVDVAEIDAYPLSKRKRGEAVPEQPMGASIFSLLGAEQTGEEEPDANR